MKEIHRRDLRFVELGITSIKAAQTLYGTPYQRFDDLGVILYYYEKTHGSFFLPTMAGLIPLGEDWESAHLLLIKVDAQNRIEWYDIIYTGMAGGAALPD